MSTQSVYEINIQELKEGLDKALSCIGSKIILSDRFGVKNSVSKEDTFKILFFKKFLSSRLCDKEISFKVLENINNLILKYN